MPSRTYSATESNRATDQSEDEKPLRSELLGIEALENAARALAESHALTREVIKGRSLLERLEDNKRKLEQAYSALTKAAAAERTLSPASEWIIDNFHVVLEQLREAREDLPQGYYRELPKLASGDLAGYPRVYAIAFELVAHSDSRIELETLKRFTSAYQEGNPLSSGELWALPISLRLALVENLRRIAINAVAHRQQRKQADQVAELLLQMASRRPNDVVATLSSNERESGPFSDIFRVELLQRLRDRDIAMAPALDWLESRLSEEEKDASQIISSEHRRQAENQATVANIITSMRTLSAIDWEAFFESLSAVERILRDDPARVYPLMDFKTRDRYRHEIERIHKKTSLPEVDVAAHAISLARTHAESAGDDRVADHVGYYLVDRGFVELERICNYHPSLGERIERATLRHPTAFYFCSLALLTSLLSAIPIHYTFPPGASAALHVFVIALSLIPASEMALSILNWLVTTFFEPSFLPRMETTSGIPASATTIVVVPTMITDEKCVQELIEKLEVLQIANEDENLFFALLSDFVDHSSEARNDDATLLGAATRGIEMLNARYSANAPPKFHLFHRRRLWNASEGKWIGWERKRGKLHEFNRLLRQGDRGSFIAITAERSFLQRVRYVITLDTDTQLPRDTARRLVGTILHPLNRAQFDAAAGMVTRGYGILQPRVGISPSSASESRFALAFSGSTGIDPYTTAVSDVYQDLFGEGIYTGKGLYDVEAFEAALGDRVPENTLLSHDLFEGLFARVALVTDVEVLDDYPSQYDAYARRLHRWIRGDWQLARWLVPGFRRTRQGRERALPPISIWKIIDNLRRSLVPPAVMVWLIASWVGLPGSPLFWTLLAIAMIIFPMYAQTTTTLLQRQRGVSWKIHVEAVWDHLGTNARRTALTLAFLADASIEALDAIIRTLWRMLVSHRHLLEWAIAAQPGREVARSHRAFWRSMWKTPTATALTALLLAVISPSSLVVAGSLLLIWFFSPSIAYLTSLAPWPEPGRLGPSEAKKCRLIARRTWRYFETFVGEADHWLPPDNFQESPLPKIAHRTSPTNVGLYLLATVASHDFGYIGTLELIERLELTFATFEKLARFRGHFFNWYDTHTLEPLNPQYVSTVDSGNLAGSLIAIKQACLELSEQPVLDDRCINGLVDTITLLGEEADRIASIPGRTPGLSISQLLEEVDKLKSLSVSRPSTHSQWKSFLESLVSNLDTAGDMCNALVDEHGEKAFGELRYWISSLLHQARSFQRDLDTLIPFEDGFVHVLTGIDTDRLNLLEKFPNDFDSIPTPRRIIDLCDRVLPESEALQQRQETAVEPGSHSVLAETRALHEAIERARHGACSLIDRAQTLGRLIDRFVDEMDFDFLFDERRHVLTIGFNVTEGTRDNSFYDLLASEARLASFVAIATGDVPTEHWFRLGRQLAAVDGRRALVSWTASMFEYLMPLLVMRTYDGTLLDETYHTVVGRQIEYGGQRRVPWGISESAYNARDLHLNYQYGPFGIPGIGLKRGLGEDLVVAPYATLLAAMVNPHAAVENLTRLEKEGAIGRYGFYDAIDYTSDRVPQNQSHVVVDAFMTHHQGMSLVALDNILHDRIVQRRFHSDPTVQATELLLQERIPRGIPTSKPRAEEVRATKRRRVLSERAVRRFRKAEFSGVDTHLLSNGTYSVMISTNGSGFSLCDNLAVSRWRADGTRDCFGFFCYLRDVRSGAVWSSGFQPAQRQPESYEVLFSEEKAEILREDAEIATRTEIIVSPEDNAELRRISITNHSTRPREIELTSYMEAVLSRPDADVAHRAFNNLFVETEVVGQGEALLAKRRPRSEDERPVWCVHTMAVQGEPVGSVQHETDRARFIGRGRTTAAPISVVEERQLSGTVGPVLDPILSLRIRLLLEPEETARVCFTVGVSATREEAVALGAKYRDSGIFDRETNLAWTRSRVELRHINVPPPEAQVFQRLATRVMYPNPNLRPPAWRLLQNAKSQSGLWAYGISGDLPIVLVNITDSSAIDFVGRMFHAYNYWRLKRFPVDLVILNQHSASYLQTLQEEIQSLARKSGLHQFAEKHEGIHLLRADVMPPEDRLLLLTAAAVSLDADRGSLESQLLPKPEQAEVPPPFIPRWPRRSYPGPPPPERSLRFFNGLGGFSQEGREYVITLGAGQWTPAPWVNVVSNAAGFGFLVTENGGGSTWCTNSRENRLTPWSNDPVSDSPGEVLYIRDEDTGSLWTPTPLPIRDANPYTIRHGQGYTVFEHSSHGIEQEFEQFVPTDADVKVSILRLTNASGRERTLSITAYYELVLGEHREKSAPFIVTDIDKQVGAVVARNCYSSEFREKVAFVSMNGEFSLTCNRREFLGEGGSLALPAALTQLTLSGRTDTGNDPCIAVQTVVRIEPGGTAQVVLLLGEAGSIEEVRQTVTRFSNAGEAEEALKAVTAHWKNVLGALQVRTPDTALDLMMNRWLLYQVLSCRLFGRSGFYQSSGAYGFRDQLQDVMSLVYAKPDVAREHILRTASRQFGDGDVQHWWHPPGGRGLRTRISDDPVWLAYVTSFFVAVTGDGSVLDEEVPYLDAPPLSNDQDEAYGAPSVSSKGATVFDHCARALERSLTEGVHGLPLMGTGDWNDGMNKVGSEGRGESIWLGWFLCSTLTSFLPLCEQRGQHARAERFRSFLTRLRSALEEHAWDGNWFLRAYFDDGTPLGSSQNEECRIDSIAQSWAVMSQAADAYRATAAMKSVDNQLVKRADGLVLLLAPPFDKSPLRPGYIKGYVPGIRENGGQYSHAAMWAVIAFAMLGDGDRAGELLAMLNPINHSSSRAGTHRYRVEPYVIAGDVYSLPPHTGRGGWTWYTGAAGWMYRAALESVLGFKLTGNVLRVDPCIPRIWPGFEITFKFRTSTYLIVCQNPEGVCRGVGQIEMDGTPLENTHIILEDDGGVHNVRVTMSSGQQLRDLPIEPATFSYDKKKE